MSKKPTMQVMVEKASRLRAEINSRRVTQPLTKRQQEVLDFVKAHIKKYSFPPTILEITEAFDFRSQNAAHQHLRLIEKKGAIRRDPNFARAITVVE